MTAYHQQQPEQIGFHVKKKNNNNNNGDFAHTSFWLSWVQYIPGKGTSVSCLMFYFQNHDSYDQLPGFTQD